MTEFFKQLDILTRLQRLEGLLTAQNQQVNQTVQMAQQTQSILANDQQLLGIDNGSVISKGLIDYINTQVQAAVDSLWNKPITVRFDDTTITATGIDDFLSKLTQTLITKTGELSERSQSAFTKATESVNDSAQAFAKATDVNNLATQALAQAQDAWGKASTSIQQSQTAFDGIITTFGNLKTTLEDYAIGGVNWAIGTWNTFKTQMENAFKPLVDGFTKVKQNCVDLYSSLKTLNDTITLDFAKVDSYANDTRTFTIPAIPGIGDVSITVLNHPFELTKAIWKSFVDLGSITPTMKDVGNNLQSSFDIIRKATIDTYNNLAQLNQYKPADLPTDLLELPSSLQQYITDHQIILPATHRQLFIALVGNQNPLLQYGIETQQDPATPVSLIDLQYQAQILPILNAVYNDINQAKSKLTGLTRTQDDRIIIGLQFTDVLLAEYHKINTNNGGFNDGLFMGPRAYLKAATQQCLQDCYNIMAGMGDWYDQARDAALYLYSAYNRVLGFMPHTSTEVLPTFTTIVRPITSAYYRSFMEGARDDGLTNAPTKYQQAIQYYQNSVVIKDSFVRNNQLSGYEAALTTMTNALNTQMTRWQYDKEYVAHSTLSTKDMEYYLNQIRPADYQVYVTAYDNCGGILRQLKNMYNPNPGIGGAIADLLTLFNAYMLILWPYIPDNNVKNDWKPPIQY